MKGFIKRKFEIVAFIPEDALIGDCKEFIESALECWGGQFHTDDPLFGSFERVKAKHIRLEKK